MKNQNDDRKLTDLISIGKESEKDLNLLGIYSVIELRDKDPQILFDRLWEITKTKHDICCLDVFTAAIEQSKNPSLPKNQCQWWYWSKRRKSKTL